MSKQAVITVEQLKQIINEEFSRFHRMDTVVHSTEDVAELSGGRRRFRFYLYTSEYRFSISAIEKDEGGYLGCTMSNRKPRAGEEHTRGNDLHDGKLTRETWEGIKNDIISICLVPIVEKQKPVADQVPSVG